MTAGRHQFTRQDSIHLLAVFLILTGIYIWSMPATVVLEDDGYFILAAYFNSVTHPPGYPLFTMLAHLFTWLPVGTVAFRVHLASAIFGALACAAVWYLVFCLFRNRAYAYIAALGLGVSATYWSQAIIAEVYTLNVLLFVLLLITALHCINADRENQRGPLLCLAFLYGLSLSNHWPLILLSTPAILLLLWPVKKSISGNIAAMVACLAAGLLPYAWLVWRSYVVPEYSFYGPIQSFTDLWFYISRGHYADMDHSITAGWHDKLQFTGYALAETARQFGPVGVVLVITGFIRQWFTEHWRWPLFLVLAYIGSTLLLVLIRDVDYDFFNRTAFRVYPLISYLVAVIWLLYGVRFIADRVFHFTSGNLDRNVTVYALAALVIIGGFLVNAAHNYRRHDLLAADYALTVLGSLEPGAVLYANADNIDGPVRYMHAVENVRPDVTVYTGRYLVFNDKLYRPFRLSRPDLERLVNEFISNTEKPVYYTNDFPNEYPAYRYGFYRKVNRQGGIAEADTVVIRPAFLEKLSSWKKKYQFTNAWDIMHYNLLLEDFCELVLNLEYSGEYHGKEMPGSSSICSNYQGILKRLQYIFAHREHVVPDATRNLLKRADGLRANAYTRQENAELEHYRGLYYLQVNDKQSAIASLEKSVAIWPHPDNPSREMLQSIGDGH